MRVQFAALRAVGDPLPPWPEPTLTRASYCPQEIARHLVSPHDAVVNDPGSA
jgi:hypothetical protein